MDSGTLKQIQEEAAEWTVRNFPNQPEYHPLLGVIEEIGELTYCYLLLRKKISPYDNILRETSHVGQLAHRFLKNEQGIRGDENKQEEKLAKMRLFSPFQLIEEEKDCIADIMIFLLNYCQARGYSAEELLRETWDHVKRRDWKQFPKNGVSE